MDFMADQLAAERVVRSLNRIIEQREKPQSVRIENGPEYVRWTLMEWGEKQAGRFCDIQTGLLMVQTGGHASRRCTPQSDLLS